MSELISGKEALIALANGEDVEFSSTEKWCSLKYSNVHVKCILNDSYEFRLAPRTITINGIEVPAPFEPEKDSIVYIIDDSKSQGYRQYSYEIEDNQEDIFIGVWRTEEEIKQVIAALRQVFGVEK